MKKLIIFLVSVIFSVVCFAQQLRVVEELHKDENNTLAIKYPKKDYSGKLCGLIRLGMVIPDAEFEGDIIHAEYKKGEWWIYMIDGASWLTIKTNKYTPLRLELKKSIESATTYVMTIEKPNSTQDETYEMSENFLVIECNTPNDAKIYINDMYEGNGQISKFLSIYEDYRYKVEAPMYHTEEGTVRLSANETTVLKINLKPAFGYLNITTNPQGAKVEINGEPYSELTPFTTKKMASGVYTIQAFKEMYKQVTAQAVVEDGKTTRVNINLIPNFGEVKLTTADNDARIYIDNDYKALGRWSGKLSIGIHKIEVKKDKHTAYAKTINVQQGQTIIETIPALQPICGKLKITSSPLGATINIDGKDYGTTPKVIQELLIGTHTVTLNKAGYTSATKQINIEEGKMAECDMTLQEGNVVKIETDKYGDKLYVDGQYIGTSPMETRLTFGNHKVEAEREGKRVSKQINVTEGSTQSVSLAFSGNRTFTVNGVSFTMIAVKGGSYTMGCTSEQVADCENDEKPAHNEYVSDFMIGETEVTQALWQAVMGSNPSYFTGDMQRPVEKVSWDDCQTFIRKLNQLTGENFRLPTEAEWEYAARGGNKSKGYKYSGSNNVGIVAWYDGNSGNTTHRVKTKQPNELGIYDMSGNVWEWCQDKWCSDYNSPRDYSIRVLRGGSCYGFAWGVRVSYRSDNYPGFRGDNFGLRLAF